MNQIAERKAGLRQELRAEAKRHSPDERAAASLRLCALLKEQPIWRDARTILFYMPLATEPDISELMSCATSGGKVAALPRYLLEQERYVASIVRSLGEDLCSGAFGIREPTPACPTIELNKLDLLLVPGVGFSLNGRRLGRGKGHYDRLLAEVSGMKCGVAFDWQIALELPAEPHDVLLDCIVTPSRWHLVKREDDGRGGS